MAISKEDVEHVAKLARIKISDEVGPRPTSLGLEKLTSDLDEILNYVKELESAPTENVEPISQISNLENIAREDEITESLSIDKVLQNAPEKQDNFIKVKKIFE